MNFDALLETITLIHDGSQQTAGRALQRILSLRNWLIGAWIVEHEQAGEDRAAYGERLIARLARALRAAGYRGLSASNLKNFRQVALAYPGLDSVSLARGLALRPVEIGLHAASEPRMGTNRQTSGESGIAPHTRQTSGESGGESPSRQTSAESSRTVPVAPLSASPQPFSSLRVRARSSADNVARSDENRPVGVVLCTDKDAAEVQYATAGIEQSVFVSRYLAQLSSETQLTRWLREERALLDPHAATQTARPTQTDRRGAGRTATRSTGRAELNVHVNQAQARRSSRDSPEATCTW